MAKNKVINIFKAIFILQHLIHISLYIYISIPNTVATLEHSHIPRQWCTAAVQVIPAPAGLLCVQTELKIMALCATTDKHNV